MDSRVEISSLPTTFQHNSQIKQYNTNTVIVLVRVVNHILAGISVIVNIRVESSQLLNTVAVIVDCIYVP